MIFNHRVVTRKMIKKVSLDHYRGQRRSTTSDKSKFILLIVPNEIEQNVLQTNDTVIKTRNMFTKYEVVLFIRSKYKTWKSVL